MSDDVPRDYRKWPPGCTCYPDEPGTESLVPCPHHEPVRPADLPYGGTSGWSGSETSEKHATDADSDGTTAQRQTEVLSALRRHLHYGLTWKELADTYGWHHGNASGALSVLHKEGHIARLAEARGKCKVYVLPEYVGARDTEAHGRKKTPLTDTEAAVMAAVGQKYALARNSDHPHASVSVEHLAVMHDLISRVYETP